MKLNLWMIANRLSALEPELHISGHAPATLTSARRAYASNCVYVYPKGKDVVCAAENDYILFHDIECEQVFEIVQDTFDFYRSWQEAMEAAAKRLDYCGVIDESWMVFHNPIVLLDASYRVLFMSEQYGKDDVNEDWRFLCLHGHSSAEVIHYLLNEGPKNNYYLSGKAKLYRFSGKSVNLNMLSAAIYSGSETCGRVNVLEHDRNINNGDMICLNYIVELLSHILGRINREQISEGTRNVFLKLMLEQTPLSQDELHYWERYINWSKSGYHYIAMIVPQNHMSSQEILTVYNLLHTLFSQHLLTTYNQRIIMMYQADDPAEEEISGSLKELSEQYGLKTVLSLPFQGTEKLHYYYHQCLAALRYGDLLEPGKYLYYYYHYALEHMIQVSSLEEAVYLVHPDIVRLWGTRFQDGSDKIELLFTYFNHECSFVNTAKELYVHRNTVVYRIRKLAEDMIYDINDVYTRDYMKMSIRILKLYHLLEQSIT